MTHQEGASPPRGTELEKTLAALWSRILDVEQVTPQDDFFQLGGDSIAAAQVVIEIQKVFGQALPPAALLRGATVADLARILSRQTQLPAWSSLVELQPQGPCPAFFCIHPVGGEVLCYANLASRLASDFPFWGVRAAGGAGAGAPPRTIPEMAARYLEEIRTLQPEGPYYLGGYSFGGSVAFEMAQQLTARGERVGLLAIVDHSPPPVRYGAAWKRSFFLEFTGNALFWLWEDLLHTRPDELLARARRKARALGRTVGRLLGRPARSEAATEVEELFDVARLPEHFRTMMEEHYRALRAYVPGVYPGRVTLFRARVRPLFRLHGPDLGWGPFARGGVEVIVIPGNHETILKEPHVRALAARLRARLRRGMAADEVPAGAQPPLARHP
jgi:thioesterase domain-containing protein/acyl carrier protein